MVRAVEGARKTRELNALLCPRVADQRSDKVLKRRGQVRFVEAPSVLATELFLVFENLHLILWESGPPQKSTEATCKSATPDGNSLGLARC